MDEIPMKELPGHSEFIGKLIGEYASEIQRPLSRFSISGNSLTIYTKNRKGDEIYSGSADIRYSSAVIATDGNLHISGPHHPTFILQTKG